MACNLLSLRFIASPAHAHAVWPLFAVIGFGVGILTSLAIASDTTSGLTPVKRALVLTVAPILIALLFHFFALNSVALAAAALFWQDQTIVFTVKDAEAVNGKGCPHRVVFADFTFADLCNVPDSLRQSLHSGQQIALHGYGTSWGIFVDRIEPLPK